MTPDDATSGASASVAPAAESAITTEKLTKRFGDLVALNGVDLAVSRGEVFGFLGPNGAGKSTTIRLLLGFLHPTSGGASILGMDIRRHHLDIMRRIGYLPSNAAFDEVVTGVQALDELARVGGAQPSRRAEIAERLHLDDETLRRKVRDYSKGTRQKLGIVQALQHDPDVIIMDEPSEGLDPLVQHGFYALLDDLRKEGKTIFFSSHIMSEVERVCDRVAIIRKGTLATVEHISALLSQRKRRVEIHFSSTPPDLNGVPGISSLAVAGKVVIGRLSGDVQPLLKRLAELPVVDLTIEPARLEDVFLEMYGEGGE